MQREDKFGYGFLLLGIGIPFLMERLLGETAAICTAAVLAVIGIGFLAAGQLHERGISRRFWQTISTGMILLATIGATVWWIVLHPDMQAIIVGSASGEIVERLPHYDTGVVLNVDLLNAGPPTITKDWALSLETEDSGAYQGTLGHSWVTGWADDTGKIIALDLKSRPFLDQVTATTPIATGARERGILLFIFSDLPRQRVDNLNNILTLSFKDVRDRTFKTHYRFPASTAFTTN